MDITAIIPIYNRQAGGERALRSVIDQDGPLREILLIDDASPEPFVIPADLLTDSRIRLIRHRDNRGESGARNTAIAEARCDWLAFLDSDDYWLPGKVASQVEFARRDQSIRNDPLTVYATGFVQKHMITGQCRSMIPVGSDRLEDFASGCWFMQGSTALFNKSVFSAAGPCDEKLRRLQDLDWFLRIALAGGSLKVAPIIGSVIEVGARPSPEALEIACRHLESKWIAPDAIHRLPPQLRRRLNAYLDIERAAARRYSGQYLGTALYLGRSLMRVPRTSIHLHRWWQVCSTSGEVQS